jgi:glycosyltransferase involved in cell wall biosynthesis
MIDILLATYNSSRYLREQIDSILRQDNQDWRLLIRDGGSTDDTRRIIAEYCQKYPDRISQIPSDGRGLACENFSALLDAADAPYIMFADHDDIWLPDKIARTSSAMSIAENSFGANLPLLVFTDALVASNDMHVLSKSYFKYQNLNPRKTSLNHLLVQNIPSGCAMLINRVLADLARPVPAAAVMHDHWLSLTAAAFGRIIYLNAPTLMYRQHSNNVFGASKYGMKYLMGKVLEGRRKTKARFCQNIAQAAAFLARFNGRMDEKNAGLLADFCRLEQCSRIERYRILIKNHIYKNGICRNIGMFLILF